MNWFRRYELRQSEIAQGADADLFRENARRSRWSLGLIVTAVLLGWIAAKVPLAHGLRVFVDILVMLSFLVGVILGRWAWAERSFLAKPDAEGPPSILKE